MDKERGEDVLTVVLNMVLLGTLILNILHQK